MSRGKQSTSLDDNWWMLLAELTVVLHMFFTVFTQKSGCQHPIVSPPFNSRFSFSNKLTEMEVNIEQRFTENLLRAWHSPRCWGYDNGKEKSKMFCLASGKGMESRAAGKG